MEEPKDLGLKVGTPEEAFWTRTKKKAENDILMANREIEINKLIIEHAKKRIKEETKNG